MQLLETRRDSYNTLVSKETSLHEQRQNKKKEARQKARSRQRTMKIARRRKIVASVMTGIVRLRRFSRCRYLRDGWLADYAEPNFVPRPLARTSHNLYANLYALNNDVRRCLPTRPSGSEIDATVVRLPIARSLDPRRGFTARGTDATSVLDYLMNATITRCKLALRYKCAENWE